MEAILNPSWKSSIGCEAGPEMRQQGPPLTQRNLLPLQPMALEEFLFRDLVHEVIQWLSSVAIQMMEVEVWQANGRLERLENTSEAVRKSGRVTRTHCAAS